MVNLVNQRRDQIDRITEYALTLLKWMESENWEMCARGGMEANDEKAANGETAANGEAAEKSKAAAMNKMAAMSEMAANARDNLLDLLVNGTVIQLKCLIF